MFNGQFLRYILIIIIIIPQIQYQSLNMDPKKYLSSLLEKTNVEMKNIVKEKSPAQFKTPVCYF